MLLDDCILYLSVRRVTIVLYCIVIVGVNSRFAALSSCIRPYVGWVRCTSDVDVDGHESPLASAARRYAVSRRLRDWSVLVDQLDVDCAQTHPPGRSTGDALMSLFRLRYDIDTVLTKYHDIDWWRPGVVVRALNLLREMIAQYCLRLQIHRRSRKTRL